MLKKKMDCGCFMAVSGSSNPTAKLLTKLENDEPLLMRQFDKALNGYVNYANLYKEMIQDHKQKLTKLLDSWSESGDRVENLQFLNILN